jgi:hypothetical protein
MPLGLMAVFWGWLLVRDGTRDDTESDENELQGYWTPDDEDW